MKARRIATIAAGLLAIGAAGSSVAQNVAWYTPGVS